MTVNMRLNNLSCQDLATFLQCKGVSEEGINSIRGNGISGDMFGDFCEEDIKDAFSVFKDRFIVRKVIRAVKSSPPTAPNSSQQQSTAPQNRISHQYVPRHGANNAPRMPQNPARAMPTNQRFTVPTSPTSYPSQINPSPRQMPGIKRRLPITDEQNKRQISEASWHGRQSPKSSVSTGFNISPHNKAVPSNLQASTSVINTQVHTKSEARPVAQEQLMNETVSSSNEEANIKVERTDEAVTKFEETKKNPYPVSLTLNTSQFHTESTPKMGKYISPIKMENTSLMGQCVPSSQGQEKDKCNKDSSENSQSGLQASFDEQHLTLSFVSSSISQFTADELITKKSVRGRPSEAQRLGMVLIRNAAQSIQIWDNPPLMKDILQDKKDAFFRYVVATAPQLADKEEIIWNRLREALQNRRKYLLDKETGKRLRKLPARDAAGAERAQHELNISDAGSLIDLTN